MLKSNHMSVYIYFTFNDYVTTLKNERDLCKQKEKR